MSELKPCPFCGYLPTKHIVRNADGVDGWVVECLKCKGGVWFWKASIHEAIAAWNTRDSRAEAVEWVSVWDEDTPKDRDVFIADTNQGRFKAVSWWDGVHKVRRFTGGDAIYHWTHWMDIPALKGGS